LQLAILTVPKGDQNPEPQRTRRSTGEINASKLGELDETRYADWTGEDTAVDQKLEPPGSPRKAKPFTTCDTDGSRREIKT